jgi:fluoride ion exporter CrcB/FEX
MVEMMDGTDTIYGPQVGNALFGYVIGILCATSSCISGTHFFLWLRQVHPLPRTESERFVGVSQQQINVMTSSRHKGRELVLVLLCMGLIGACAFADTRYGSTLYRELWLALLMAPFGALIRWRLKTLNVRPTWRKGTQWFPWGTFTANFAASTICILTTALKTYIFEPRDISSDWVLPVLVAVITGFAGSLSTTSSLAHELLVLETLFQSYCYAFTTIICSLLVCILIYVPIARFG